MVGDAHLELRVAQQAANDGRADRAGPARDQHAGHRRCRPPPLGESTAAEPASATPLRRPASNRASAA